MIKAEWEELGWIVYLEKDGVYIISKSKDLVLARIGGHSNWGQYGISDGIAQGYWTQTIIKRLPHEIQCKLEAVV